MLEREARGEFWCPLGTEKQPAPTARPDLEMTAADWAALSRFSSGDWISDAHIARLESLGLLEIVFGQALLTRLGRTTIGMPE